MNKTLQIFYLIILFLSSLVYISKTDFTFLSYKNEKYLYIKYFLIWISSLYITYSLFNTDINQSILPTLLFLNVGALLMISIYNDNFKNKFHFISILGIIYLLFSLKFEHFKLNRGKLVYVDKTWLYQYIVILLIWYLTSSYISNKAKIICVLLVLYPLLYPLDEYFIHRLYSLVGVYLLLNI